MENKDRTQQEALSEAFPDEIIRQVQGLDYVPVAEVVSRLNNVLGTSGWSSTIVEIKRDQHNPEYVIAQVSISAQIDGKPCVADGVGGKQIAVKRGTDQIIDLGKDFKSAYSDALKKAAQRLGVGLHLARDDDAIYAEEHKNENISIGDWNAVNNIVKSLPEEKLGRVKVWWADNGNGPKPKYETIDTDTFEAYRAAVTKIKEEADQEALSPDQVADMLGGKATDEAPF